MSRCRAAAVVMARQSARSTTGPPRAATRAGNSSSSQRVSSASLRNSFSSSDQGRCTGSSQISSGASAVRELDLVSAEGLADQPAAEAGVRRQHRHHPVLGDRVVRIDRVVTQARALAAAKQRELPALAGEELAPRFPDGAWYLVDRHRAPADPAAFGHVHLESAVAWLVEVAPDPTGRSDYDGNVGARILYQMIGWGLSGR